MHMCVTVGLIFKRIGKVYTVYDYYAYTRRNTGNESHMKNEIRLISYFFISVIYFPLVIIIISTITLCVL